MKYSWVKETQPSSWYVGDGVLPQLGTDEPLYKVQPLLLHHWIAPDSKCSRTAAHMPKNKYLPKPKVSQSFPRKATKTSATLTGQPCPKDAPVTHPRPTDGRDLPSISWNTGLCPERKSTIYPTAIPSGKLLNGTTSKKNKNNEQPK